MERMTRHNIILRIRQIQGSRNKASTQREETRTRNALRREIGRLLLFDAVGAIPLSVVPCFVPVNGFEDEDFEWLLQEELPVYEYTRKANAKGWTLRAIAERWNVSVSTVQKIAAQPGSRDWDSLAGLPDQSVPEEKEINEMD
jgi:hypothetical protein